MISSTEKLPIQISLGHSRQKCCQLECNGRDAFPPQLQILLTVSPIQTSPAGHGEVGGA